MSLSSITNRVSYAGDGSSTIFAFPFYFFNQADLKVYLFDINSNVIYPQSLATNYTVGGTVNSQGVYPSGGTVIMNSSFPANLDVIITRSPSQVQNYVLNQNGPINSVALVQQLDYLTALVQRMQDQVSRCIQVPDGMGPINGSSFNPTLPSNISGPAFSANAPLVINSGATGITTGVVATGSPVSYIGTLPVINGGTGQNSPLTPYGIWYSLSTTAMAQTLSGPLGTVLTSQGSSAPIWSTFAVGSASIVIGSGTVSSGNVIGILPTANGGTGTGSSSLYPQYSLIYASSVTQFGAVPSATAGLPLLAQGSGVPVYSQINLSTTTALTGIMPVGQGGTGTGTSYIQFGVLFASSATQFATTATPTGSSILTGNSGGPPTFQNFPGILNQFTAPGQLLTSSGVSTVVVLPVGSSATVLTVSGSSLAWSAPAAPNLGVTYQGTTYNIQTTDNVIFCASSSWTATLPTAVGVTGKEYIIKHVGTSFTQVYTLNTTGGQSVDGAASGAYALYTFGETLTIVSDGANWQALDHKTETQWSTAVATGVAATGTALTKGTLVIDKMWWKRRGQNLIMRVEYEQSAGGADGTGIYIIATPANCQAIDSTFIDSSTDTGNGAARAVGPACVGSGYGGNNTDRGVGIPRVYDSTHLAFQIAETGASNTWGPSAFGMSNVNLGIGYQAELPITGWRP